MQSSISVDNVSRSDARRNDNAKVAYGLDRYSYQQGENAKFGFQITENSEPALVAKGGRRSAVIPKGDKRVMCNRLQVGAEPTSSGEQTDNLQAIGFDGYNGALTGDKQATLGVNCGLTTGRNGVLVLNEQDKKGYSVTEDKTNALLKDPKRQPVICLNDQGGAFMSISMDKTGTLRAQMDGHPPVVYTLKIRGGAKEEAREH